MQPSTPVEPAEDTEAVTPAAMATYEQLHALAANRRSTRGFDADRPVTDEQVRAVLDVARWAPSGGNGQPWHFLVIRDEEDRAWNVDMFVEQQRDKRAMEQAVRGQVRMTGAGFRRAPVHILVLGDPRVKTTYPVRTAIDKPQRHLYSGLANATLLVMLAATSIGLATQYVSDVGSPYMGTMLRVRYGIPDFFEVYELVPLGWPSKSVSPTPRRELDSMVHYGRFESDKLLSLKDLKDFLWRDTRVGGYGKGESESSIRWDDDSHVWW